MISESIVDANQYIPKILEHLDLAPSLGHGDTPVAVKFDTIIVSNETSALTQGRLINYFFFVD